MDGEVSPDEVRELIEEAAGESLRIVDIRDRRAFERGHIPGSENLPFEELTGRVDEIADADRIVTVCPHGKASVQAARLIGSYEGSAGTSVESMAGGLEAWADAYDLVAGADGASGDDGTDDTAGGTTADGETGGTAADGETGGTPADDTAGGTDEAGAPF